MLPKKEVQTLVQAAKAERRTLFGSPLLPGEICPSSVDWLVACYGSRDNSGNFDWLSSYLPYADANGIVLKAFDDALTSCPVPILAGSHDRFFLDKLAESIFVGRGDGEIHRFTGYWTDWQAKRRAEAAPSPKAEKPKPAAERPRERKLKFTFKEQREFETIDADLAELEAQITACQTEQESCGSDYVKLQELQARQAELEAALEEKTERWVYLNELKEQIDAQNG